MQAAPWFNQAGMGTQYELPLSIDKLLSEGFIIKIN
jgi:Tuberculosis necrotizing toxin